MPVAAGRGQRPEARVPPAGVPSGKPGAPGKREVPDRGLTQREAAVCVTSSNPLLQRGFQELLRARRSEGY